MIADFMRSVGRLGVRTAKLQRFKGMCEGAAVLQYGEGVGTQQRKRG